MASPALTGGYRNLTAPVSLLRTLASTRITTPLFRSNENHFKHSPRFISSPKRFTCLSLLKTDSQNQTTLSSSSNSGYPEYNRLMPCPAHNLPPRIEHMVVLEDDVLVSEFISKQLDLPPLYVADLIRFGAVHYALVCPKPPPTATPEQIKLFEEVTSPSVLKKRSSVKGKTVREAQKTFRVTHTNQYAEAGTYLRVHVHPKRSPRCYEIDWKSRIVAMTDSYVILDKPAGTTVGGTTDNIEESCATFASRALDLPEPLKTTHQIDNCTEGCVVFARTKEYCSVFHTKIRNKEVKKLYRALAAAPLPTGIISHYMRPKNMAPRLVSEDSIKGWHLCQLEVLECMKIPWPDAATEKKHDIEDCGWTSKEFAYECTINLLTGKTHQIRAQLAACGAPLVGDSMYMPAAIAEMVNPEINPYGKAKKHYIMEENEKETAVAEWIDRHGKEPRVGIGLQACQISWDDDDGEHFYEAGTPWWR
ncbi:Pseudouridine synthase catalytic domain superfamily [Arabidopsis thaliana x Arabidopsis arenosa]|uniref:Pseudouridine synthase catalytic domain superfamily n=1 Tax=Arabidopsis thaliana x Arabidopsis arenosa TaxID=1240361 RepID=A0A8T1YC25_9BRAS|nr:Pseudouridine synthase catalytic domain superfamily [Arabidopsis thaliana x Arabidopsis arenosa]